MSSQAQDKFKRQTEELRKKAQERLRQQRPPERLALAKPEDIDELIHELEIHQVELEVQNEELRQAQLALTHARDRYLDLYEFAPVGYLSVDAQTIIQQANLAAATLCNRDRTALIGMRMEQTAAPQDRDNCYLLFQRALENTVAEEEMRLLRPDRQLCWVNVQASCVSPDKAQAPGFRVTLTNITERKRITEQLRAVMVKLADTEERERRKIAELLHDDLQQLLVAANYQLDAVLRQGQSSPAVEKRIVNVQELIAQTIDKSRSLASQLSPALPPLLHERGLVPAIHWLARQMKKKYDLHVDILTPTELDNLNEAVLAPTYNIVRELLFNVAKHADTFQATVEIRQQYHEMLITVQDKGKGFDMHVLKNQEQLGLGLPRIRERLRTQGGRLDIHSASGEGSRITAVIPLNRGPSTA